MKKQGLSFRGTLFLITVGTGLGALLPVIAGVHQLTLFWWLGVYALTFATILRIFDEPYYDEQVEDYE